MLIISELHTCHWQPVEDSCGGAFARYASMEISMTNSVLDNHRLWTLASTHPGESTRNHAIYVIPLQRFAKFYHYPWCLFKKTICHAERSEASIIRHASSPCTGCE